MISRLISRNAKSLLTYSHKLAKVWFLIGFDASVSPRTTIWIDRTLNFVNDHWGRILNPNNATQTHSIFVKILRN